MDPNASQPSGGPPQSNPSFLPNFCDIRMVFGVVLVAELLAIVLQLAQSRSLVEFWQELGLLSLFIQWIALTGAALLCGLRRYVRHLDNRGMGILSYVLLLAVTLALSELAFRAITLNLLAPEQSGTGHAAFLLRNMVMAAIVGALFLRYLYVQHQWKQQVQAEALARLQALRARIRPHFLFNSLNTIAALTQSRPVQAEEAVQDLADLFRATLADARDRVSLEEEIDLTQHYVKLEALRLGDRLEVDWQLVGLPERLQVPSLLLQPLVENAIYHGIESLPEGGVIRVWGHVEPHQLVILVSNPTSPNHDYGRHEGNRIAQDNIRQRLELAYGPAAGLKARQQEQRYEVELRIPLEMTR